MRLPDNLTTNDRSNVYQINKQVTRNSKREKERKRKKEMTSWVKIFLFLLFFHKHGFTTNQFSKVVRRKWYQA